MGGRRMNCCDLEMPAVYDARTIKARKAHKCSECAGVIKPGETYKMISGLWDGRWDNYKQCADCQVIICDLGQIYGDKCDCIPHGHLIEELYNLISYHERETGEPIIAAYNAAAKHRGGILVKTKLWEDAE